MSSLKRKKSSGKAAGGNAALDMSYHDASGALKTIPILGALTNLGALTAAVALTQVGNTILIWNDTTSVHYVKFGTSTVTAPTGAADGIPVPPRSYVGLVATDTNVIADAAGLFGFMLDDDTYLTPENN